MDLTALPLPPLQVSSSPRVPVCPTVINVAASIDQPTTTGQSDLNQLLAKLGPSPSPAANNGTLESLFSGMTPSPTVQQPGGASHTTQGIALLNSIFASATVNAESSHLPAADSHLLESQPRPPPDSVKIYSPIPNNAALPQILNQDVISTLLGLPPSRAPSVADSYSGASPVQEEIYRPGDDAPVDAISRLFSQAQSAQEPPKPRLQQVNGDATPRAPMTTLSSQPEVCTWTLPKLQMELRHGRISMSMDIANWFPFSQILSFGRIHRTTVT